MLAAHGGGILVAPPLPVMVQLFAAPINNPSAQNVTGPGTFDVLVFSYLPQIPMRLPRTGRL
jgi:hypothetical protein